jgi:hypothetical protein
LFTFFPLLLLLFIFFIDADADPEIILVLVTVAAPPARLGPTSDARAPHHFDEDVHHGHGARPRCICITSLGRCAGGRSSWLALGLALGLPLAALGLATLS